MTLQEYEQQKELLKKQISEDVLRLQKEVGYFTDYITREMEWGYLIDAKNIVEKCRNDLHLLTIKDPKNRDW